MVMIEELGDCPQPERAAEQPEADSFDSANEGEWVEVEHGDAGSPPTAAEPAAPAEEEDPAVVQEKLTRAEAIKAEGNRLFSAGQMQEALEQYTAALEAAPHAASAAPQRAIYLCNRAACHLRLEAPAPSVADCTAAIDADPQYLKAYLRRAAAYEALDDLEHALSDVQKAKELDPGCAAASAAAARLEPVVAERREKMKDEMMGKLKELGNTVLGKFGLSLDNFKAEKDPATGSYSIKFQ